jgi:dTDP-4-dehydrorhamnose reductase
MKILVTGANGLVGRQVVRLLVEEGKFDVHATGKGPCRIVTGKKSSFVYHNLDLASHKKTQVFLEKLSPSVIIHLGGMTQPNDCELDKVSCWKINVGGTRAIVRAAQQAKSYLIYVSTDFVFDGEEGPYDETAEPAPLSTYGESKLLAEQMVQMSGLPHAIVRTVLVYGPPVTSVRNTFPFWVKDQLERGNKIKVVNDQVRTPTFVNDLAKGILLVLMKHAQGIYHISGNETTTPYQLACSIADLFGKDKSLITPVDASTFEEPAKRPLKTGFIIDKATRELGYVPISLDEGLRIIFDK